MTDPKKNQERLIELAYNRSTETLRMQAEIANSADQRALVFATLSVAAGALVFDALREDEILFFAIGPALFFCLSAFFSTISAVPGRLYTPGSRSTEFRKVIDESTPYFNVLLGLCQNNDEYISENERAARWRAHCYRFAILLFMLGLALTVFGVIKVANGE